MTMDLPRGNIFIYCDDPSHSKRIAVTNFHPAGDGDEGRWNEWYTSRAAQGARESGTTLVDDVPPEVGTWLEDPTSYQGRDVRSRYRLECRKCRHRTAVPAREDKFFAVLNLLAEHGVSEISLNGLAASLGSIST